MMSYSLYNSIAITLADVSRFSNLLLNQLQLPRAFQKCIICKFPSAALKVMASKVFSIVNTFQIWACLVMCVYKLSKGFLSADTLLNFRKVTKYELDTCTSSIVIKIVW